MKVQAPAIGKYFATRTGESMSIGIGAWVVITLAFLVIHAHMAARLPMTADEALLLYRVDAATGKDTRLAALMVQAGQAIFDNMLGSRLLFVVSASLTALLSMRIVSVLFRSQMAVLMVALWVNGTLLVGFAGFLATSDAAALLFLTAMIWALVELQRSNRDIWWVMVTLTLMLAIWADVRVLYVLPAPLVWCASEPQSRRWLRTFLPWIAVGGALTTLYFTASGPAQFARPEMVESLHNTGLMFIALTPVIAGFMVLGSYRTICNVIVGHRVAMRATIGLFLALLAGWILSGFARDVALWIAPMAIIMAAGSAIAPLRRIERHLALLATPIAAIIYLASVLVVLFPTHPLALKLPPLHDANGWDNFAPTVSDRAAAVGAGFVVSFEAKTAARLNPYLSTIPASHIRADTARHLIDCTQFGIFLTEINATAAVGTQFRGVYPMDTIERQLNNGDTVRYFTYSVAEPIDISICQPGTARNVLGQ